MGLVNKGMNGTQCELCADTTMDICNSQLHWGNMFSYTRKEQQSLEHDGHHFLEALIPKTSPMGSFKSLQAPTASRSLWNLGLEF